MITYSQIEAATKEGPEAVAALLHASGVELAGLPKPLRRKLRGEAPEAEAESLDALKREDGETDASYNERLRLLGRSRPTDVTSSAPAPTGSKREPSGR